MMDGGLRLFFFFAYETVVSLLQEGLPHIAGDS